MTRHTFAVALTFAVTLAAASCASSSKQSKSETSKATSSSSDSRETADESEKKEADDHPVVPLESLIGEKIGNGQMPEGCPGEWSKLEGRNFDGKLYACNGFHAPHRYEEPTVVIGIREGQIRRINLQSFYEPGQTTAQEFRSITNDYQTRCDRMGGAGSRMRLQCDGYLVALRMQQKGGMVNIVYALKSWDLQY